MDKERKAKCNQVWKCAGLWWEMPATVENWFRSGYVAPTDALINNERRDNIYLSLPTTVNFGIKLRAKDKIEVKQRRGDMGVEPFRDGISGCLEQWVKWSFPLLKVNEKGNEVKPPDIALPPRAGSPWKNGDCSGSSRSSRMARWPPPAPNHDLIRDAIRKLPGFLSKGRHGETWALNPLARPLMWSRTSFASC